MTVDNTPSSQGAPPPKRRPPKPKSVESKPLTSGSANPIATAKPKPISPSKKAALDAAKKKFQIDFTFWASGIMISLFVAAIAVPVIPRLFLFCVTAVLGLKIVDLWIGKRFKPFARFVSYAILLACFTVITLWLYGISAWKSEMASQLEGDLISPPSNRYDSHIVIGFGRSEKTIDSSANGDRIRLAEDTGLRLERGPNGTILVTTTVRDANNNVIVSIEQNHWRISPDSQLSWDHNYTNDTLEVEDGQKAVVLQIELKPNRVNLQGIWHLNTRVKSFEVKDCVDPKTDDLDGCMDLGKTELIPTLFRYPSRDHWGELRTAPFVVD